MAIHARIKKMLCHNLQLTVCLRHKLFVILTPLLQWNSEPWSMPTKEFWVDIC